MLVMVKTEERRYKIHQHEQKKNGDPACFE